MKASSNNSAKPNNDGTKSKSAREAPDHTPDRHQGQPPYKKQALSILSSSPIQSYKPIKRFTLLKLPINELFNTFKDQL